MKGNILLFLFIFKFGFSYAIVNKTVQAKSFANNILWAFEENKGQVTGQDSAQVKFFYKKGNLTMFLLSRGIAYQFEKIHYPEGYREFMQTRNREDIDSFEKLQKQIRCETYRMDIELVGANPNPEIITEGKSLDYIQYYNHNALDVHAYQKITYKNIYPNIDWVIYLSQASSDKSQVATQNSQLVKYDFIVHPGGNPKNIKLETHWVEDLNIKPDGSLTLVSSMGSITENPPISLQDGKEISTQFKREGNTLSFQLENYDKNQTIVIDPSIAWSTYYGGNTGATISSCAIDNHKSVYAAGYTNSSTGIAFGGYQMSYSGGIEYDGFIVKFNDSGIRKWATYYGGVGLEYMNSIAFDPKGNIYVTGVTGSSSAVSSSGFQNSFGGGLTDAFLVKFDTIGVRKWATYYGGTGDENGNFVSIDKTGNVYISGDTKSTSNIASSGHQNTYGGGTAYWGDAFLTKFSPTGTRIWSTYYGGSNGDVGLGCSVDNLNNVYLSGYTNSSNNIGFNGFKNSYSYISDISFLVKFDSSGVRKWGTYYGNGLNASGGVCACDNLGNVYLAGETDDKEYMFYRGHQKKAYGNTDAYLVKFSSNCDRLWSTYLGGSSSEWVSSLTVDSLNYIFVSGGTSSNSNIASNGFQNYNAGSISNGYIVKYSSFGSKVWGSYIGGSNFDYITSSASIDSIIYVVGHSQSANFPVLNGFKMTSTGFDGFITKIMNTKLPEILILNNGNDTICAGDTVLFKSIDTNEGTAPQYKWYRNNLLMSTGPTYLTNQIKNGDSIYCILKSNMMGLAIDSAISNFIYMNVYKLSTDTFEDTICSGSLYSFNNLQVFNSGLYNDTFKNIRGCDSILVLRLFVRSKDTTYLFDSICMKDSIFFNGGFHKDSKIYYDTLLNVKGCDSIIVLNLSVRSFTNTDLYDTICFNQSIVFNNQSINTEGLYRDTLMSSMGCDSFIFLHLSKKDISINATTYRAPCGTASYTFEGVVRTQSGRYTATYTNVAGCDSFVELTLTLPQHSNIVLPPVTICPGQSYTFADTPRTQTNTYTQVLTNSQGCDSTIILSLIVLNNPTTYSYTFNECTPFTFKGITYTNSTQIKDTQYSAHGCDSAYNTYQINLSPSPNLYPDTTIEVCDSIWVKGVKYQYDFSFNDTIKKTTIPYCDSIYQKYNYKIFYRPIIGLKTRDTFLRGSTVKLHPNSASNYLWSTGETQRELSIKLTEDKSLTLIVWNSTLCPDTTYIDLVAVDLAIVGFPTGFSPMGQHIENRTFRPNINGIIESARLDVFNRWGEKIYSSTNPLTMGWNGYFKGEPAPAGLYSYIFEYTTLGHRYIKSGEVELVW